MIKTLDRPLITRCNGINNKLNPKRLPYNDETGLTDLAEGVNIDIDDSGMPETRLGQVSISDGPTHSAFCDGGTAYCAQDGASYTALYRINADFSLTPIVDYTSGLATDFTKGAYFSYTQVGSKVFFTNGYQKGYLIDGVSYAWPVGVYKGPDEQSEFSQAPTCNIIAYFDGRMWVAVDHTIYCSLPYKLGLFRFAKYYFKLSTTVKMIRPVASGVWVSNSTTTGFIKHSDKWDGHTYERKAQVPAHLGSDYCRLSDLSNSQWQIPGLSAVWSSDEGKTIGTPDGQLINVTSKKLVYPAGSRGATVVSDNIVINSVS